MRHRAIALALLIAACAPLQKPNPSVAERRLGPGVVERKEAAELSTDEDRGARIAVGLLAAGIPGAVMAGSTEADLGRAQAWRYHVRTTSGEVVLAQTFSAVNVGDCVVIYQRASADPAVVERQSPENCKSQ